VRLVTSEGPMQTTTLASGFPEALSNDCLIMDTKTCAKQRETLEDAEGQTRTVWFNHALPGCWCSLIVKQNGKKCDESNTTGVSMSHLHKMYTVKHCANCFTWWTLTEKGDYAFLRSIVSHENWAGNWLYKIFAPRGSICVISCGNVITLCIGFVE